MGGVWGAAFKVTSSSSSSSSKTGVVEQVDCVEELCAKLVINGIVCMEVECPEDSNSFCNSDRRSGEYLKSGCFFFICLIGLTTLFTSFSNA